MKQLSILFFVCFLFFSKTAKASHAMGGEMSYSYVGNNTYKIVLNFYRDCSGIPAFANASIHVTNRGCGGTINFDTLLNLDTVREVGQLCTFSNTTCHTGTIPGVKKYTYSNYITLPDTCSQWVLSFSESARNTIVTNSISASSYNLYFESVINNLPDPLNGNLPYSLNSIVFKEDPIIEACVNLPLTILPSGVDLDNDSLVFEMMNPLGSATTQVPYSAGFSYLNPFASSDTMKFDVNSGLIKVTPNVSQVTILTLKVSEFKRGIFVGSTMRDVQIIILNCNGAASKPLIDSAVNLIGCSSRKKNELSTCKGSHISFDMPVTSLGQAAFLDHVLETSDTVFKNASVSLNGTFPNYLLHFDWIANASANKTYHLNIRVKDNNCPVNGWDFANCLIAISDTFGNSLIADTALTFCSSPLLFKNVSGNNIHWSPASYFSNPTGTPTLITVPFSTWIKLQTSCGVDSVYIHKKTPFSLSVQLDSSTCPYSNIQLNAIAGNTSGGYSYEWLPALNLVNPATNLANHLLSNPKINKNGIYDLQVNVKDSTGCVVSDTLHINAAKILDFEINCNPAIPNRNTQITLSANLTAGVMPPNFPIHWTPNAGANHVLAPDSFSTPACFAYSQNYTATLGSNLCPITISKLINGNMTQLGNPIHITQNVVNYPTIVLNAQPVLPNNTYTWFKEMNNDTTQVLVGDTTLTVHVDTADANYWVVGKSDLCNYINISSLFGVPGSLCFTPITLHADSTTKLDSVILYTTPFFADSFNWRYTPYPSSVQINFQTNTSQLIIPKSLPSGYFSASFFDTVCQQTFQVSQHYVHLTDTFPIPATIHLDSLAANTRTITILPTGFTYIFIVTDSATGISDTIISNNNIYTLNDTAQGVYSVKVIVYDSISGTADTVGPIKVSFRKSNTGIANAIFDKINIAPIPTNGSIFISGIFLNTKKCVAEIYDAKSALCKTQNISSFPFTMDLKELSSGVYYLKLQLEEQVLFKKIVKY